MRTLCILGILALLLTILLPSGEVVSQDSPLSPVSPLPPPPRPTPAPTSDAELDRMAACWYQCKVVEGYTGGEPLVTCYKECMAASATPTPSPMPTPIPPSARVYVGTWWRSPEVACELWQADSGYVLLCP